MERLGDFAIDRVLGEGGSAIVYAARLGDEAIALKVLRPELSLSEREVAAFLEEAHRAQRVTHPGLISIRDAGVLPDGRPYLAMPVLRGECLAERVARGPMPLELAMRLFTGLAGAIDALHAGGLVHRDIKPENIFLVGEDEHLVLLDLGIARDIDAPASTTTQAGLVRGTPAYMAPERFFGARASRLTDTYEAAVVLYSMLTGRLPWDHAQDSRGRMSPRDPRSSVPLPELVAKALLGALSVDETARPQGVLALLDELSNAAISSADTKLVPVQSAPQADPEPSSGGLAQTPHKGGLSPAAVTLQSAVAAKSAGKGDDFSTQDTVAITTGKLDRRSPSWLPAILTASLLVGAAAGAWAFLVPARQAGPASGLAADTAAPGSTTPVHSAAPQASTEAPAPSQEPTSSATAAQESPAPSAGVSAGAKGSAAPSAAPKPAGQSNGRPAPSREPTLADCYALMGTYCSSEYKLIDPGGCAQAMQRNASYQFRPRAEWDAQNVQCRTENMALLFKLAQRRHTPPP